MARKPPPTTPEPDEPIKSPDEILAELFRAEDELRASLEALKRELASCLTFNRPARSEGTPIEPAAEAEPATNEVAEPAPEPATEPAALPDSSRILAPPQRQATFDFAAPVSAPRVATRASSRPARAPTTEPAREPHATPALSTAAGRASSVPEASGRAKRLSDAALAVLDAVTVEGHVARIPPATAPELARLDARLRMGERLERKLYEEVNAALVALGGAWTGRKVQGHVFSGDPREAIEAVVRTGAFVNPKDVYSFFATPGPVATHLVQLAGIEPGDRVLEPSAGAGALVVAIAEAVPSARVVCVECDPARVADLRRLGHEPVERDFLAVSFEDVGGPVDRVVMNPPFSLPGAPSADMEHVAHAFDLLRPGGRLAAIMGTGVLFRQTAIPTSFRRRFRLPEGLSELLRDTPSVRWGSSCEVACGSVEALPAGAFASSGTNVATVIITLEKP